MPKLTLACKHGGLLVKTVYRHNLSLKAFSTSNVAFNSVNKNNQDNLINPYGIQCLQPDLREKVFGKKYIDDISSKPFDATEAEFQNLKTQILRKICDETLEKFKLKGKPTSRFNPVNIKDFPNLEGPDLETHFLKIGKYLADPYTKIIDQSLREEDDISYNQKIEEKLKILPTEWVIQEGWTKYSLYDDEPPVKVDYPEEEFLAFDVETLPKISNYPVMASAKSVRNIYCWLSPALIKAYNHYKDNVHTENGKLEEWKKQKMQEVPLLETVEKYYRHLKELEEKLEFKRNEKEELLKKVDQLKVESEVFKQKLTEAEEELKAKLAMPLELIEIETRAEYVEKAMAENSELDKRDASKAYTEIKLINKKQNSEIRIARRTLIKNLRLDVKDAESDYKAFMKRISLAETAVRTVERRIEKFESLKLNKLGQIENTKKSTYETLMNKLEEEAKTLDINPPNLSQSDIQNLCPVNPTNEKKVIVGHNVAYDRARILEEYDYNQTNNFFMDTLALHVAVFGMCSKQRLTYFYYSKMKTLRNMDWDEYLEKKKLEEDLLEEDVTYAEFEKEIQNFTDTVKGVEYGSPWVKQTSMNSLKECSKLYLDYIMEKDIRDVFTVSETFKPVVDDIQNLITYCASDTLITEEVFRKVYPTFKERLPHPVSTAALKSMGQAFLPVNKTKWNDYVNRCEGMYLDYTAQIQQKINIIIENLIKEYAKDKEFWVDDPWLSQLNWEQIPVVLKNDGTPSVSRNKYQGMPSWYKDVCKSPGEIKLTVTGKLIPLFFKLKYLGKPVVFENLWMDENYVLSHKLNSLNESEIQQALNLSEKELEGLKDNDLIQGMRSFARLDEAESVDLDQNDVVNSKFAEEFVESNVDRSSLKLRYCLCIDVEDPEEIRSLEEESNHRLTNTPTASGRGKRFMILHPDDGMKRVVRLVSKAFKPLFDSGAVASDLPLAKEALDIVTKCGYWVSNRKRIMGQWVVDKSDLMNSNKSNDLVKEKLLQNNKLCSKEENFKDNEGMILPGLITMGTVTRRAVENTWLTASNIKPQRIGSELKSLIEAPEGYCFVGADVDSEELWIGSLLADSLYENHGSTPLGWMTLEGSKKEGTDMHTNTANILNTSRDNAKIFNYSRIYGAGQSFTSQLLNKLDPSLTKKDCEKTTADLYLRTKGKRHRITDIYFGGSESALFTKLTEIASQEDCRTPVLKAKITECLSAENNLNGKFITSRINWIIQSSGVDYLHLLITSMEYLIRKYDIKARLTISIHDEIRFICKEEDKYRTAMALQISNIWTRAMFCQALHIDNLPQSCAFFSGVDIDKVLRKEVFIDCVTVSSPTAIPPGEVLDIYGLTEKVGDTFKKSENIDLNLENIKTDREYRQMKYLAYSKTSTVNDLLKLKLINEPDVKRFEKVIENLTAVENEPKNLQCALSNMVLGTSHKVNPRIIGSL